MPHQATNRANSSQHATSKRNYRRWWQWAWNVCFHWSSASLSFTRTNCAFQAKYFFKLSVFIFFILMCLNRHRHIILGAAIGGAVLLSAIILAAAICHRRSRPENVCVSLTHLFFVGLYCTLSINFQFLVLTFLTLPEKYFLKKKSVAVYNFLFFFSFFYFVLWFSLTIILFLFLEYTSVLNLSLF